MPQPKNQELGVRQPLSLRVGLDVRRFKGMCREGDAGAIDDDQFHLLENVRLDGGAIGARPGLAVAMDTESNACIYGIWDERNPIPPVDSSFTTGTWLRADDIDSYRCLIADEVLPYFYDVQFKRTGGFGTAITDIRIKRFERQVAGEPNFLLIDDALAPGPVWCVGATTFATASLSQANLTSNVEGAATGEVVGGAASIGGAFNFLDTFSARNGLVRFSLRTVATGAVRFYVCDTTFHTVTLEASGTLTALGGMNIRDYFTQAGSGFFVCWFPVDGLSHGYDYPALTETHTFPPAAPASWFLGGPVNGRMLVLPRLVVGSSSFVPAYRSGGGQENVGLFELDSGLTWTTRAYSAPTVYAQTYDAFLSGSDIYMYVSPVGGGALQLIRYSGGAWNVVGTPTGVTIGTGAGELMKSRIYNGRAWMLAKNPSGGARELFQSDATLLTYTAVTALALGATYDVTMEFVPDA